MLDSKSGIGVIGAGTMGTGIAQVAATAGHTVHVFDVDGSQRERASASVTKVHDRLVEKGKLDRAKADAILERVRFVDSLEAMRGDALIVEAIVESLAVKKRVFEELESLVDADAVMATNTSSLSVTAIAASCERPARVLGTHFFNPAPLLPLVEIVPGIQTAGEVLARTRERIDAWGKTTVVAKDTPGFIVNRVARPFYGEALRILEEGIADVATIDWAMEDLGGFRMGPFKLMDLIGNDVNFAVTESVYEAFYYDPRYRPSFTQKRMVEAGRLGRKSGRGYYDYASDVTPLAPTRNRELGQAIVDRILAMLINEAADAVFMNVAAPADVDLAMTKGVNYPKGLLAWADELGVATVLARLASLHAEYGEDRYRPCPLLRRMVRDGARFHGGAS